jgi:glycerol-3-phosphate dehydrogenase
MDKQNNNYSPISPTVPRERVSWPDASKDHYGVIVVGAGLVGCMIKKVFEHRGVSVLLIDKEQKWSASKCSVGVTSDGWLGDDLERARTSFSVMSEIGIDIDRITAVNMDTEDYAEKEFYFINPAKVLTEPYFPASVLRVGDRTVEVSFKDKEEGRTIKRQLSASYAVVVAAGAWTEKLLCESGYENQAPHIDAYWGANYDLKLKLEENRFGTWAPYKHSLLMQFPGFVRFSDGNTVKNPKGVDDARLEKFTERLHNNLNAIIMSSLPQEKVLRINEGIRPYTEKGDFIRIYEHGLFSATGGRKNTSALAGWMADELWKRLMGRR